MKVYQQKWRKILLLCMSLFIIIGIHAQTENRMNVTGVIIDNNGEPVIGASIVDKSNPSNGTISDLDGLFSLNIAPDGILRISYIGYITQEIPVNRKKEHRVILRENTELLDEVVVIGYGSVKKDDLTGSVTAIKVDEMNKGLSTSPQDMLGGKIAGVSVVSGGGEPGAGSTIRIRGGSSLSAKNDPLIVVDGVIMSNETVGGLTNGLSTINPADIETFTVLKDASATAIYGSRASNGVILITTKKGKTGKIRVSYNANVSISTPRNTYDVLTGDEYRDLVNSMPDATDAMKAALNLYPGQSTDWQDEIYRTAVSTDHNVSVLGAVKDMPFRASLGFTDENGILKTSNFQRYTGNLSFTPKFFDDHLSVNLNAKGTYIKNRFANKDAIGSAVFYDPTKPVYNGNTNYGGYFTWTDDGKPDGSINSQGAVNPLALLKMTHDKSDVKAFVGNAQFDYKIHFLPDLRLNINVAYDYSNSDGKKRVAPNSPSEYGDVDKSGSRYYYEETFKNALFESYLQYAKELPDINSRFDIMGGYSYQSYKQEKNNVKYYLSRDPARFGEETSEIDPYKEDPRKYVLISFYGRLNYTFMDRYLLTFTLRDDGSSRFAKDNRWGLFPSLALAWRIKEEAFMQNIDYLSNLKLRLGWGNTGQQDISDNWYPSRQSWSWGKGGAMYPFYDENGNVTWVNVIKPTAANPDLKWETTTTWNVGLDYGFLNNRINGTIDYYDRKTKDLLNAEVNVPAGTDFAELVVANIGTLTNRGLEFSINAVPVQTKDFSWDIGYNIGWNKSEITALTFDDAMAVSPGKRFESTGGTGGKTVKIHSVGHAPGSFYVYEQIYDDNGSPIEGAYVDRSGDGIINDDDLYQYKKPEADVLMGFSSKFTYKKWDLGFNGRVSLGNYMYYANEASNGGISVNDLFSNNNLTNRSPNAVKTGFSTRQRLSDHYVQNASFLKIDNITLGYSFNSQFLNGRVYGTVQNPIVITKYDGLDPEISNGMDKELYPRPVMFIMGVNLNF